MLQEINEFCYQPMQFRDPQLEFLNKELEQLKFQCNLKLLQQKVIMLFGFPSIKVESDRIHNYLQGIYNENEFEQHKKLRVLISFIGEVTYIDNWNERGHIIRQRVLQFLNIQGIEVRWNEQQWQSEIDSIVTLNSSNPYYDTIPNKTFSYADLFNTLGIQLPTKLKCLEHQSFNQIQTSNLIDDFHLLCNIDEFNMVRNIRQFIQKITDKLNEFMSIIINIETMHILEVQNIKNRYEILCQELQHILNSFIPKLFYHYGTKDNQKQQLIIDQKFQEKNQQLPLKKSIPTASSTTIIQRTFGSKTKKQKKKIKQEDLLNCRQSLLFLSEKVDNSFNKDDIKQSHNSSQIQDNESSNDLISQIYNQLLNNTGFSNFKITEYSLENLKSKILTYEYIQFKLEQLGYPCIKLNENELISVLQEYKIYNQDKRTLVVKLFNIISESFISQNGCLDVNKQLKDQAIKYLSQISIDYHIQDLNQILKEQCIPKFKMQDYDNLRNQKFSYEKLSQILNRKFPEQVYQIKCSSTKLIFQQWSINQLLDIFNFYDLQNIRVTRSYLSQVFSCLQELINFKELLQSDQYNANVIQEFMKMEKQFLDVINQPLNFHLDSQCYHSSNLLLLQNQGNFDDLSKQQLQQSQDLDKIKVLHKSQKEQKCRISNQEILKLKFNQPSILNQFSLLWSQNQSDSPRFSFIDNSQQQSDDQQQNSADEEFFS